MREPADTAYAEAALDVWTRKNIRGKSMISSCPPDFPYAAVISACQEHGKHFVSPSCAVGVPYLREVIANRLFRHLPEAPYPAVTDADRHAAA
jgi:hypothetical protein